MSFSFLLGKVFGRFFGSLKNGQNTGEIERELPFAVMLFTLMAASGVTLYDGWKKMRSISLLPTFRKEAEEVVRQVEVLGYDPLTVMYKRAENTKSRMYRDFLAGYVSSVKSGVNVVSFLKSKMRSMFEAQSAASNRAIEKLGTLIEAYAVMLIVTLCAYILYVVVSSSSFFELTAGGVAGTSNFLLYLFVFLAMPMLSVFFIFIAHTARKGNILSLKECYRRALFTSFIAIGVMSVFLLVPSLQSAVSPIGMTGIATICFLIISVPPWLSYRKIAKVNFTAEESMPSFLRDVSEARKIGLSPEKSIIHASKRGAYGNFSDILGLVRSQIEWGVSLKKIFENVKKKIRSWPVLVHFFILVETIEIGGGSATALEILSEYSEKAKDIESNKRATLKPYVVLAFIWSILIALTTTIVAMTIYILGTVSLPGMTGQTGLAGAQEQMIILSVGIILQCWLSGFFIGKISEGAFAAGFKYSAILAVTAYISLLLSQSFLMGMQAITPT
ncbi:MAG: type II secretion system F family protein [Candidatus Bathyarchaeales archaeon]